ncbi:MAG TPA: hypothetical protein EYQ60_04400 [Myxococcales bacterium]|nr:hypothetical protein [Myxococcales bacterium]
MLELTSKEDPGSQEGDWDRWCFDFENAADVDGFEGLASGCVRSVECRPSQWVWRWWIVKRLSVKKPVRTGGAVVIVDRGSQCNAQRGNPAIRVRSGSASTVGNGAVGDKQAGHREGDDDNETEHG